MQLSSDLATYGEYSEDFAPLSKKKAYTPVNHLGGELSPYLLSHAHDPVGWYSWGPEAFEAARRTDKPLFVSIGCSSNHWCHVMNRECFSDQETAGLLNDACIPVCVDREERPDIDALFMEVCRILHNSGGYPLNVFMTPEGKPFFVCTWLPKRTTGRMPGITELLPRVKWLWVMQRDDIERSAVDLAAITAQRLEVLSCAKSRSGRIGKVEAFKAVKALRSGFDVVWGGFGGAPKNVDPVKLLFLGMHHDDPDCRYMIDVTMRRMWRGGVHDHLGGGFFRMSADERWLVPHFEKLLCDQAMLLLTAAENAHEEGGFMRMFAEDVIFCLLRDFSDNASYSQGFKSSIDGDTGEGEGRYYLWREDEIKAVLPVQKLPTVKAINAEYAELIEKKKSAYAEYRKARDEMKELLIVKANVDRILGIEKDTEIEKDEPTSSRS